MSKVKETPKAKVVKKDEKPKVSAQKVSDDAAVHPVKDGTFTDKVIEMFKGAGANVNLEPQPEPNSLSLGEVMTRAWASVKGESDPPLNQVTPEFLGILHAHALAALKSDGALLSGDTIHARFESAVNRLRPYYKGE